MSRINLTSSLIKSILDENTNLSLSKEDVNNKSTNVSSADGASDDKYPSVKSVKTYVDASATLLSQSLSAEVSRAQTQEALKEVLSNKSTNITMDGASDTKYSSVKSVKTYVDSLGYSLNSALNAEVSRATAAEQDINSKLTALELRIAALEASFPN